MSEEVARPRGQGAARHDPPWQQRSARAELAEEMVRKHGPVWLMNHCKAHFQTTDKVLAACGMSRADLPPEGQGHVRRHILDD